MTEISTDPGIAAAARAVARGTVSTRSFLQRPPAPGQGSGAPQLPGPAPGRAEAGGEGGSEGRSGRAAGMAPSPPEARWLRPARVPGQGHGVVHSHCRPRRGRQRDTGCSTGLAPLSVPPYPAPGTPCGSVRARPRMGGLGLLGSARTAAGGVPRAGNGLSLPPSPTLPLHLPLVPGSAGGGAGCAARGELRRTAPHITAPPVGRPPRGAPREERGAGAAPPGNGEGSGGAPASPPSARAALPAAVHPPPLLSPVPVGRRGGSADSWAAVPGERRRSGEAARRDSASPPEREDEEEEKEGGGERGGVGVRSESVGGPGSERRSGGCALGVCSRSPASLAGGWLAGAK